MEYWEKEEKIGKRGEEEERRREGRGWNRRGYIGKE
jgi:hypothetical protein